MKLKGRNIGQAIFGGHGGQNLRWKLDDISAEGHGRECLL